MAKPEGWEDKDAFVYVSQEATLVEVLQTNGYVIPGIPEIYVLSKASPFLEVFKKQFN